MGARDKGGRETKKPRRMPKKGRNIIIGRYTAT